MARKKNAPRTSAENDMGMDDAAAGLNGGASTSGSKSAGKKAPAKRAPRKSAGKSGQMSLTEEEARERKDAPPAPEKVPPAGVKGRGSSRRSAVPSRSVEKPVGTEGTSTGAAEYLPSGRSPDQHGAEPNEARKPSKQTDRVDPEHETPHPQPKSGGASTVTTGPVPPPVIPGETEERSTSPSIQRSDRGNVVHGVSLLTDLDIHLFREGRHYRLYEKLGAHPFEHKGVQGTIFAVWAPNAESVSVMGDFNGWDRDDHALEVRDDGSGIWEGFVPGVDQGMIYKYHIRSRDHMYHVEKSDPFAFAREMPPQTASVVNHMRYEWHDGEWMDDRDRRNSIGGPISVYEMHVGSWRRKPEDHDRPLTYRELAGELPAYLKEMGFTHVEFMPVMYHPFNGSWGYQITGYFAAASQYGSPQDLMHLIDVLHQHGIGVIMDWVPSHFPSDEHGLIYFDGTHLFEHADTRKGFHPDWNSYIFNYGRNEVRSFLISNALFWLDKYHVDGLRVDAVASMLYLDYSRKEGEWIPNEHGGRENLEAISLLKDLNHAVHTHQPGAITIAEESTAWPGVTGGSEHGGLGFDLKWMMGWMHDTLRYLGRDPIHRRHHQGEITFSIIYAFSERFMLPLSHDEVVHGKGSLIARMPGDEWQRFANLRLLFAYMFAHPGKKLLYMGSEIAQHNEWNHDRSLDWHLLQYGPHAGVQHLIKELNAIYQREPALHSIDLDPRGFEWIDYRDEHNSVVSFVRRGHGENEMILVICNFTPVVHHHYRMGVPRAGRWEQILNSDEARFGGSGFDDRGSLHTIADQLHGRDQVLELKLPPLGVVYYKYMS